MDSIIFVMKLVAFFSAPVIGQTTPGVIQNFRVVDRTSSTFDISFDAANGADQYRVVAVDESGALTFCNNFTGNTGTVSGLLDGTSYTMNITAENQAGLGLVATHSAGLTYSVNPPYLVFTEITSTSITVVWPDQRPYNTLTYLPKITSLAGVSGVTGVRTATRDTQLTAMNLLPGEKYTISIRTFDSFDHISNATENTTVTLPGTIVNLRVINQTTTSVALDWTDVQNIFFYSLAVANTTDVTVFNQDISVSEFNFEQLSPGILYTFSIKANNKAGFGESKQISAYTTPPPPTNLIVVANSVTETTLIISFDASVGAASYNITYNDVTVNSNTTSYQIAGLSSGTSYSIFVQAITQKINNIQLISDLTDLLNVTTVPSVVQNVQVIERTSNSFNISFDAAPGADQYLVLAVDERGNVAFSNIFTRNTGTISGLLDGTNYTIDITAENQFGFAKVLTSQAGLTRSVSPPFIIFSAMNQTSVTVSWPDQRPLGSVTYRTNISSPAGVSGVNGVPPSTSAREFTATNLIPGEEYTISVLSTDAVGDTPPATFNTILTLPDVTSMISVVNQTTTSVALNWTDVKSATSYRITVMNSFKATIFLQDTTKTAFAIPGLTAGTMYDFFIAAENPTGLGSSKVISAYTVPLPPSNLIIVANSVTETTLTISFDASVGAASYNVTYNGVTVNTNVTSYQIAGLSSGTSYNISVQAISPTVNNVQLFSELSLAVTVTTVPGLIQNFKIVARTSNSFNISFDAVSGADQYRVLAVDESGNVAFTNDFTRNTGTVSGLLDGTNYTIDITSENQFASGKVSSNRAGLTRSVSPSVIIFSSITSTSFTVSWEHQRPMGRLTYKPTITSTEDVSAVTGVPISTSANEFTASNLTSGTEYNISLLSSDSFGDTSSATFNTTLTLPGAPNMITIVNQTITSIALNWTNVKSAIDYHISIQNSTMANLFTQSTTMSNINVQGLSPGTRYIFVIVVKNQNGFGPSKDISTYTTPLPPANLLILANSVTTTTVTISFDASVGAASYNVTYNDVTVNTNTTSYQVTGLSPGTSYNISVQAISSKIGNIELFSTSTSIINVITAPDVIQNFRVDARASNSFNISFDAATGTDQYRVLAADESGNVNFNNNFTGNTATVSGLLDGTNYTINITAENQFALRQTSMKAAGLTRSVSPPSIVILSVNSTSFRVLWKDQRPAGTLTYKPSISSSAGVSRVIGVPSSTSSLEFTVTNLMPGTEYTISLLSTDSFGDTSPDTSNITLTLPGITSMITVINQTTTSVALNWTDVQSAINYRITVTNSTMATISTQDTAISDVNVQGLSPGTRYIFSIMAENRNGFGFSKDILAYAATRPPTNLILIVAAKTTLTISFDASVGATSYNITYNDVTVNTNVTSYQIAGLSSGSSYNISVQAVLPEYVGNALVSDPSTVLNVMTAPDVIQNFQVASRTSSSFNISFDAVNGADLYRVVAIDENGIVAFSNNFYSNTGTVGGLLDGTNYTINVTAENPFASGKVSTNTAGLTRSLSPPFIILSAINQTSFTASWTDQRPLGTLLYFTTISSPAGASGVTGVSSKTSLPEFTATNLIPGTDYTIDLFTSDSFGNITQTTSSSTLTLPDVTSMITVANQTTTSIALNWTDVKSATNYMITVANSSSIILFTQNTTASDLNVRKLSSGIQFKFWIVAENRNGVGFPNMVSAYTKPTPPANLIVVSSSVRDTAVTVSFDASVGAASYRVTYNGITINTNVTLYQIPGLSLGTSYNISVQAVLPPSGNELMSDSSNVVEVTTAPDVIQNFKVVARASNSFNISFDAVTGADQYRVLAVDGNGNVDFNNNFTANAGTVSGLLDGTNYTINITAENQFASGKVSMNFAGLTRSVSPPVIIITSITPTSFTVNWEHQRPVGRLSYIATITSPSGVSGVTGVPSSTPSLRFTAANLQPGTEYTIMLLSADSFGNTTVPTKSITLTLPDITSMITVFNQTTSSVALNWQDVKSATSYRLTILDSMMNIFLTQNVEVPFFIAQGLSPGFLYNFSIEAENRNGFGGPNTTMAYTVPLPPANLIVVADSVTETTVTVSFDGSGGAASYNISYGGSSAITVSTSYQITGLTPGSLYSISVQAVSPELSGVEVFSDPSNVLHVITNLGVIQNFTVVARTSSTFGISFDPVTAADLYRVVAVDESGNVAFSSNFTGNAGNVSGLLDGTKYVIEVTAGNQLISGRASMNAAGLTRSVSPPFINFNSVSQTSFIVSWPNQRPLGTLTYIPTISSPAGVFGITGVPSSTSSLQFTVTNLIHGTEYTISLLSNDSFGQHQSPTTNTTVTLPDVTSIITIVDQTTSSVVLDWQEVKSVTSYKFTVMDSNKEFVLTQNISMSGFNVQNLSPGILYNFSVMAENRNGLGFPNSTTAYTVPLPPSNLILVPGSLTETAVTISFDASVGAASYNVTYNGITVNIDTTTYQITGLMPGVTYSISVKAILPEHKGIKLVSAPSDVINSKTVCETIRNFKVDARTSSTFNISFDAVTGADQYRVLAVDESGNVAFTNDFTRNTGTVSDLLDGTNYTINIAAENQFASGKVSSNRAGLTRSVSPPFIHFSAVNQTSFTVRWTDQRPLGTLTYKSTITSPEGVSGITGVPSSTSSLEFTVTNLIPGSEYTISLLSTDSFGDTQPLTSNKSVTLPDVIGMITVVGETTASIVLDWQDVKSATNYRLTVMDSNMNVLTAENTAVSKFNVQELFSGTLYVFSIEAENRNGFGLAKRTSAYTTPLPPFNLIVVANSVTETTLTISFDASVGATSYNVTYNVVTVNINVTLYQITGLTTGTTYNISVQAILSQYMEKILVSDPSQVVSITTETVSDPCANSPCHQLALCSSISDGRHSCVCRAGFEGDGDVCNPFCAAQPLQDEMFDGTFNFPKSSLGEVPVSKEVCQTHPLAASVECLISNKDSSRAILTNWHVYNCSKSLEDIAKLTTRNITTNEVMNILRDMQIATTSSSELSASETAAIVKIIEDLSKTNSSVVKVSVTMLRYLIAVISNVTPVLNFSTSSPSDARNGRMILRNGLANFASRVALNANQSSITLTTAEITLQVRDTEAVNSSTFLDANFEPVAPSGVSCSPPVSVIIPGTLLSRVSTEQNKRTVRVLFTIYQSRSLFDVNVNTSQVLSAEIPQYVAAELPDIVKVTYNNVVDRQGCELQSSNPLKVRDATTCVCDTKMVLALLQ